MGKFAELKVGIFGTFDFDCYWIIFKCDLLFEFSGIGEGLLVFNSTTTGDFPWFVICLVDDDANFTDEEVENTSV